MDSDLFFIVDNMGDDAMVVNAARVSMGRRIDTMSDADVRLLNYLARNGHKSPFYHPQISAHVRVPIFVARQWMRHHVGMTYNEISGRYVDFSGQDTWHPDVWRKGAENVKQGSAGVVSQDIAAHAYEAYFIGTTAAIRAYNTLIAVGVCREQARAVLPLGTFTEYMCTGSLYAWFNFWRERSAPDAQHEIREYAETVGASLSTLYPHSWKALKDACTV